MIKYHLTHSEYDCCGCRACEQICSHEAIVMQENFEGFLYPCLDENLCINCGLCNKVCPIEKNNNEELQNQRPIAVKGAQHKKQDILHESSSGGIFSLIAEKIINWGGVVYGASYLPNMYLSHIRITTVQKLSLLRGSKYVQSDTVDTYQQVKMDLKQGRWVYYTGTPCQIRGLQLFLRKDYSTLLTSDLICHGTPSLKIFKSVIEHIQSEHSGIITNYLFRDKNINGWSCSSSAFLQKKDKNIYLKYDRNMEAYFKAFIKGDLMRRVCYQCKFANIRRCGDITLADYWGVRKYNPEFPNISKGVSLLLINTQKGIDFWNNIKLDALSINVVEEHAIKSNSNLRIPTPQNETRNQSYQWALEDYECFKKNYAPQNYVMAACKFHLKYYLRHTFLYRLYKKYKGIS